MHFYCPYFKFSTAGWAVFRGSLKKRVFEDKFDQNLVGLIFYEHGGRGVQTPLFSSLFYFDSFFQK